MGSQRTPLSGDWRSRRRAGNYFFWGALRRLGHFANRFGELYVCQPEQLGAYVMMILDQLTKPVGIHAKALQ